MEIWKEVPDYENYQVSNFGRVKSLWFDKERILKAGVDGRGYLTVGLSENSNGKTFQVHQLVAICFLGHEPCGLKIVVDHIDNNPLNNHVDNLQLTTQRHNLSKDKKGYSSKYVGVSWCKRDKKWKTTIQINGKNKNLGQFTCEIEASEYYQNALICVNENRIGDIKVKKPNFSSEYRGVCWSKQSNKWHSQIKINGKRKHLGYFNCEIEAAKTYENELEKLWKN